MELRLSLDQQQHTGDKTEDRQGCEKEQSGRFTHSKSKKQMCTSPVWLPLTKKAKYRRGTWLRETEQDNFYQLYGRQERSSP